MEKSWKDILREGQEAYDPKAWEAVSRRLDQSMPVKGKTGSPKNWLIGGSAALLVGAGLYFLVGNEGQKAAQHKVNTPTEQLSQNESPALSGQETNKTEQNTLPAESKSQKENGKSAAHSGSVSENQQKKEQAYGPLTIEYKEYKEPELLVNDPVTFSKKFVLPKRASEYCINEEVEFVNTNDADCYLLSEYGSVVANIHGNSKRKVQLSKPGVYAFKYPKLDEKNAEISEVETAFMVTSPQLPEFSCENEITYEQGVPYINLKAQYFSNGMNWSADKGEIAAQAENTKMTVFRKGDYRITLEKKDQQGCIAKKTQTITVREDYNLLAPTAFRPASNDPRNNHFMPFALTQRNTGFELLIIDPETGRTVFKSSSADNAWDGSDMNSEQADKVNKAYLWKVKLQQPERGEKSEYSGTVMRLIQ